MSSENSNLKKHVNKKFKGAFNDFIDLFDTPTKYTNKNDIVVINESEDGLIFKDPTDLLTDLIVDNNLSQIKVFKQYFGSCNELIVQHDLNIEFPMYKIYTSTNEEVLPGDVEIINNNIVKFYFQPSLDGKIVIFGS